MGYVIAFAAGVASGLAVWFLRAKIIGYGEQFYRDGLAKLQNK